MRKKKGGYSPKYRLYLVLVIFSVLFLAILARAFELQVLKSENLKKMAMRQHRKTVSVQSRRGDIYDRNLKELAVSIEVDSVFVQPSKIESPRQAVKVLSAALSIDRSEIERKISSSPNFVWLKRQVDLKEEQRKALSAVSGVGIMKESRRFYPNKQLASNLVGFTGLDSNGLEGVELFYDSTLKGENRKFTGEKDAMGRLILFENIEQAAPSQGMVVELTIDKNIQYITEKALKKAVEASGAKGGTALVMDPLTGEILAMASLPTFDPNNFGKFEPRHWRNRVVTDLFEPGSTFKLFLVSAALEEGIIRPGDSFFCENGSYKVADRVFHDHEKYGWLTVSQIIKYSSNIGSAKVGEKLGRAELYRYLKAFGFGAKTGIDLPGEAAGSLRRPSAWSNVTLHTVSFGQGVSVTGVQLISALSAISNGGFLMKPYIVRSVKDQSGAIVTESNPFIVRRVISEQTAKKVTDMLVGVTKDGGTGLNAALDDFEVAGKTGTAQKPDLKNGGYMDGAFVASFFGFVPARSPRLSILVTIDEPRGEYYGGAVAAPVFKEIARQSLSYMGVFRQQSGLPKIELAKAEAGRFDEGPSEAAGGGENPAGVPDFTGKTVRAVLKMALERSIEVNVIGSGRAVSQRPAPGQSMPGGKGHVIVSFR